MAVLEYYKGEIKFKRKKEISLFNKNYSMLLLYTYRDVLYATGDIWDIVEHFIL